MSSQPIAIAGAGTMGWQIALTFALRGELVRLTDNSEAALDAGLQAISHELRAMIDQGTATPSDAVALGRIVGVSTLDEAVDGCWLVIEAIPERLDLKRSFFAHVSSLVSDDTILATNSSSFRSRDVADVTARPERLLNMHFYGRPWLRPAVELMTCGSTEPEVIERVASFLRDCQLRPFVCQAESTGFIFNRVWHAIKAECLRVVADGVALPAEIDELWRIVIGTEPFGPFERMDRVGLDVVLDIERHYANDSGLARDLPPQFLIDMVERGELGGKSGSGFFSYPPR